LRKVFPALCLVLFFSGAADCGEMIDAQMRWQTGDAARGKVVAEVRCLACHSLHSTNRRIGPGLKGIFNRRPTISGVPFERWDTAALDAWLSNPRAIKANTGMNIPSVAACDRADMIAYFRQSENSLPDK